MRTAVGAGIAAPATQAGAPVVPEPAAPVAIGPPVPAAPVTPVPEPPDPTALGPPVAEPEPDAPPLTMPWQAPSDAAASNQTAAAGQRPGRERGLWEESGDTRPTGLA